MRRGETMRRIGWGWVVLVVLGVATGGSGDDGPKARLADQAALGRFAPLVGAWKGTGQVRRGSNQGAWTETSDWAWKLAPDSARLELTVTKGKFLRSATLAPDPGRAGEITLEAVLADGSKRLFRSESTATETSKPVVFRAEGVGDGVRRLTLTIPNESRYLLTFESVPAATAGAVRLGEVGSTRVGAAFAAGESGPKCIVTGGRGTQQVTHNGKPYWVCCSGCRDLFQENPAAILAEAAAKQGSPPGR